MMRLERFQEITSRFAEARVAVVGDICLDRYFEIDPGLREVSIETNLPVYNITNVRCQPGGAGTILNNLHALGAGEIYAAGIIGRDGEGYELRRALERDLPRVRLDFLVEAAERRTFTYTKPLLIEPGKPPVELNRLDIKNWEPTPAGPQKEIREAVLALAGKVQVMVVLDQVDAAGTGVVTATVIEALREAGQVHSELVVLADSRRGLKGFPPAGYKMNAAEMAALAGKEAGRLAVDEVKAKAAELARGTGRHVFVTLAENGIVGAFGEELHHVPALPTRGPIDIVGAGDAVTASLASALAAGASLKESLELAMLASSLVIHQLGTTGTAGVQQMLALLRNSVLLEA